MTGKGCKVWPDGTKYTGDFVNGKSNGKGIYIFGKNDKNPGTKYMGAFLNGFFHGKGRMEWPNGNIYTGDFVKGKRTGKGCLQWADGTKYTGDFVNGHITGKGCKVWPNGTKYTGDFVNGNMAGKGEIFFPKTGSRYIGEFEHGIFHGRGTVTFGRNCIKADGTYAATGQRVKNSKSIRCESPEDRYEGNWNHGIPTGGWYYHKNTGLKTWSFLKNGKWVHLDHKP